jgi:hypothetical protein
MAKKSKRQARVTTPVVATQATETSSRANEWNPDYSYVTKDLRRIGVIAGSLVTLLVVLAIILN